MVELPATQSVGPRVRIDSTMRRAQRLLICMLCAAGLAAVVLSQLKVYPPDWERSCRNRPILILPTTVVPS